MKSDRELLMDLAAVMEARAANDSDAAVAAFDRLGFAAPATEWDLDLVRQYVLTLERMHEAGDVAREFSKDMGLLYYRPDAATLDQDGRIEAYCALRVELFQTITGHLPPDTLETWRPGYPAPYGGKIPGQGE